MILGVPVSQLFYKSKGFQNKTEGKAQSLVSSDFLLYVFGHAMQLAGC